MESFSTEHVWICKEAAAVLLLKCVSRHTQHPTQRTLVRGRASREWLSSGCPSHSIPGTPHNTQLYDAVHEAHGASDVFGSVAYVRELLEHMRDARLLRGAINPEARAAGPAPGTRDYPMLYYATPFQVRRVLCCAMLYCATTFQVMHMHGFLVRPHSQLYHATPAPRNTSQVQPYGL